MFKMTLNRKDGIMMISYSGYFTVYDAKLFQRELEFRLSSIRPEDYVLVVDMQEVRLSTPELAPLLDEINKTYTNAPFRYIFSVESEGWVTAKLKRKPVVKANWTMVPTVDEALKLVRNGQCAEHKDAGHVSD